MRSPLKRSQNQIKEMQCETRRMGNRENKKATG